ncbi:hypothetical protein BDA96_02G193100 [Sorghum bicolor]|uniref:RING-type domain-containing protein n=2 Tax=Sorghum bicolor TaxID=4558 RepID=A0A921RNS7_SORBI|nr:hypothetical protein BDA96_02G193100 [Sorghum bicolor]OQU89393.1 hypothetical protein SORBI_3002G182601 [Sorghum bicolor]
MEPMEWVAVSPCGHREVCVRCAASIRFFHNDLRCCICRSHCSTVVVTKASSIRASGQRDFPFLWPPPPAFASEVLVGHYFWYHRGMRAYFDDLFQYKEMKEVCSTTTTTTTTTTTPPPPSSEESSRAAGASRYPDVSLNVSVSQRRRAAEAPVELEEPSSSDDGVLITLYYCCRGHSWFLWLFLSLLTIGGFLMLAEHPYPDVLIVLLVCVLFSAFTACTVYAWRKFSNNSLQWRR